MNPYFLQLFTIGLLLLFVTLGSGWIARLPLSYALIYLLVGIGLSPYGVNLIQLRPDAEFLERLTEFVVLVSLFSCGLKMTRALRRDKWQSTIRLIGLVMPLTILGIAAVAHWGINMPWGAALLLAAILAPTDPVMASEVQLSDPNDQDELRFGLTSEGGLNDALAFPLVFFGLHWIENANWQEWFVRWVLVDILWATLSAIALGMLVARAVVMLDRHLQKMRAIDEIMEDYVALAIVLLSYSVTVLVHGYGFLAVFVAGVVTQRSYRNPERGMSQLGFMEQIEKLMEIASILLLGSLLRFGPMQQFLPQTLLIAGCLFFLVRPLASWVSTIGTGYNSETRWLFGWFGIRGVGSLYYLAYALGEGLEDMLGEQIAWITFTTVVLSVVIHGISATPLMEWYHHRTGCDR